MGVGLQPLEFTECLADSPHFRENLQRHEKELERTSQQIKRLIKEVKDVVQAAKRLGAAQLALAASMEQFEFACIGASMTEDERVIGRSLHHFANLIRTIEDERDRMLGRAHEQIIQPLEKFRKEHIGAVKEGKKKFDKKTAKFCQSQERTLSLSTKKPEAVFQEADAAMDMAERDFCQASLEYVFQLQAVQERKKFELVETLLGFVFGWWTFHHTAHDVHADAEPLVRDLQLRIQRTRSNFEETSKQTESLMKKMMEVRQMAFGTTWSKQYCTYEKMTSTLTLMPYNQINVKTAGPVESVVVVGARPVTDAERRFCWEALVEEKPPLALQAAADRERAAWIRTLRRAGAPHTDTPAPRASDGELWPLDDAGFEFVRRLATELEARGLDDQGLYRVAGVSSKVSRLVSLGRSGRLPPSLESFESRTLTSALKSYLRALPDPLLTRRLHDDFLAAAKCERSSERVSRLYSLVRALPPANRAMLQLVLAHLERVAARSDVNLMTSSNLAVCFGPTLLRAERETVASILELKFYNVLVEALLDNISAVFAPLPPAAVPPAENHNGIAGTSPSSIPLASRNDISVCDRSLVTCGGSSVSDVGVSGAAVGNYSPHHHQLLQHFSNAHTRVGRCSSSSESVSSHSASPPPRAPLTHSIHNPSLAFPPRTARVRTLYACLGESEGELSFEPNQIITNVSPSAEPGWLRGSLNGKSGLVPQNYVEPLP
ncbi:rho GTPase-activating protein 26 [Danaus plexippus plexippus]|uniref:Rho GTPase-activating protein 26 n=1 Tax=Danaus plexippus plexippus TaxID=278856 RepID=A0A212FC52_DANPL|nr:rho GTPase-activating protein 26 [Danaus plexippus plexippus]